MVIPLAIATSSVSLSDQKVRLLEQPAASPYPRSQPSLRSSLEILHPVPDSKTSRYETLVVIGLMLQIKNKQLEIFLQYSFDIILQTAASSARLTI